MPRGRVLGAERSLRALTVGYGLNVPLAALTYMYIKHGVLCTPRYMKQPTQLLSWFDLKYATNPV